MPTTNKAAQLVELMKEYQLLLAKLIPMFERLVELRKQILSLSEGNTDANR